MNFNKEKCHIVKGKNDPAALEIEVIEKCEWDELLGSQARLSFNH